MRKCPAIMSEESKLFAASFLVYPIGICAPVSTMVFFRFYIIKDKALAV